MSGQKEGGREGRKEGGRGEKTKKGRRGRAGRRKGGRAYLSVFMGLEVFTSKEGDCNEEEESRYNCETDPEGQLAFLRHGSHAWSSVTAMVLA